MLRSYMEQIQSLTTRKEAENRKLRNVNRTLLFWSIATGLQWVFLTMGILSGYISVTYNF